MNREPIALYLFRFVSGFALLAFMALLYFSSVLLEEDMREVKQQLQQLRGDLYSGRQQFDALRGDLLQALLSGRREAGEAQSPGQATPPLPGAAAGQKASLALLEDSRYPNLFEEDPFYTTTLPSLLPSGFYPSGTFHSNALSKPENLHPFAGWFDAASWRSLCMGRIAKAKFGFYDILTADLALKMEERVNPKSGFPEFWVFLRDGVYWAPLEQRFFGSGLQLAPQFLEKHKVTARDFKFFIDALLNPHVQETGAVALRTYLGEIEEVELIDELTFVIRWRGHRQVAENGSVQFQLPYAAKLQTGLMIEPLPCFVYQYFADGTPIVEGDDPNLYRTSSIWAQSFAQHWAKNVIVSCGPWLFDGMSDEQIAFRRNPDFYDPLACLASNYVVRFRSNPDSLWLDFKTGQTDSYNLQPDKRSEWELFQNSSLYQEQRSQPGMAIATIEFLDHLYGYIGWNQKRSYFSSAKVRRAMTMAIDRRRLIDQFLNGMGVEISAPFSPTSPAYDPELEPLPFDPMEARRLLEEEGWVDLDGDGIVEKLIDGQWVPFTFALSYYVKSPQTKAIAEWISTSLKEIGVLSNPNGLDIADLTRHFEEKNFDALMMAWSGGTPPEDPRQLWHSEGANQKGSSNMIGYANPRVDQLIEQLTYAREQSQRVALYHQFDQILHEEQPYTLLYMPKRTMLYRTYLQNVFIPSSRQELIPGAQVNEPQFTIYWLQKQASPSLPPIPQEAAQEPSLLP